MTVVLKDQLVDEAFKAAQIDATKEEVIEIALKEYVNHRKRKNIRELKGMITLRADYDYKCMRN